MLQIQNISQSPHPLLNSWKETISLSGESGALVGTISVSADGKVQLWDMVGSQLAATNTEVTFQFDPTVRNGADLFETISTGAEGQITSRIFADALGHVTELIGYTSYGAVDLLFDPSGNLVASRDCYKNYNGFNGDSVTEWSVDYNGGGYFVTLNGEMHDAGWHGGGSGGEDHSSGWGNFGFADSGYAEGSYFDSDEFASDWAADASSGAISVSNYDTSTSEVTQLVGLYDSDYFQEVALGGDGPGTTNKLAKPWSDTSQYFDGALYDQCVVAADGSPLMNGMEVVYVPGMQICLASNSLVIDPIGNISTNGTTFMFGPNGASFGLSNGGYFYDATTNTITSR